ncbi:MAG: universal stress protein [Desulfovibrionaceae bacterium]|nr:universal stress protein [Desulfovibrionaceae bacterium]
MTTDDRLRILICIGGGPDAYAGLKYAARLSKQSCAHITLLYVRPTDSGLKSGGMEMRVARENVLDWGLELPGMTHLKAARDILIELGEISDDQKTEWRHRELSGDHADEYRIEYENSCGAVISLKLRTAEDITSAVADEAARFNADLIVVGASPEPMAGLKRLLSAKPLALRIAAICKRSIIVARHLEPGHGLLVCVQDTDRSRAMLPEAVRYARACQCPVSILSVAPTEADLPGAQKAVAETETAFTKAGITPTETLVEIGDPVATIITIGYDFSLIVASESLKPWFAKGFSVSHEVARQARNSVMIVK